MKRAKEKQKGAREKMNTTAKDVYTSKFFARLPRLHHFLSLSFPVILYFLLYLDESADL